VQPCAHAGRFDHLQACLEPDWQAFGGDEAAAAADLIQLAERLGCRDQPRALPHVEAVCLARGADAILTAIENAGKAAALAAADPAAAAALRDGLVQAASDVRRRWLPGDTRNRVECAFAVLAPDDLRAVAADVRRGLPGAPQHAYAASQLLHALLEMWRDPWLQPMLASKMRSLGQVNCRPVFAHAGCLLTWPSMLASSCWTSLLQT
jgi:hypothetical protein